MGVTWVENDEDVFDRLARRRQAEAYRQQNVSQTFASLLASYEAAYPEANAGVKTALARMGLAVNSPEAQKIVAMQHDDAKSKGWLDRVGDVVGGAAHLVDKATGPVGDVFASSAKGVARAAFVALETPLQEVQNFSRAAIYESLGGGGGGLSGANRAFGSALQHAGTSSGREVLSKLVGSGDVGDIDLGTGVLPGGKIEHEVRQRAGELEMDFGNAHFGGPNGQAITLGRVTAATVFEPGTAQYNIASGLVDGLVAWFGDPASAVGSFAKEAQASSRLGRAARAGLDNASLGRAVAELAVKPHLGRIADDSLHGRVLHELAGMIPGHRPTTALERTDSFLTKQFAPAIDKIAEESDALTLSRKFGNKPGQVKVPMHIVRELAAESDPQQVAAILRSHIGRDIADLPEYLGYRARMGNKKGIRMFDRMPGELVNPDDLDEVVGAVELSLRNMRIPAATRDALLRKVIDNEDRSTMVTTLVDVFGDAAEDMVGRIKPRGDIRKITQQAGETAEEFATRQKGEVSKVAQQRARGLVRMFKEDTDKLRAYVGDEIVSGDKAVGLVIDGTAVPAGSPFVLSELLNSGIPMPDARDIRQATSRIARLVDNPLFEHTDDVLTSLTRGWKQLTLLRPAYAVRVLGEEMVRMTASGLDTVLNHPINYVAALVMNPKAAAKFAAKAERGERHIDLSPHGKARQKDFTGANFYDDDLLPATQELSDAVSQSAANLADVRYARERHYDVIQQAHPAFKQAWHNSLGEINKDDIWRKVAESKGNLDTVEIYLWGEGQGLRRKLAEANPDLLLDTRQGVHDYVESLHRQLLRRTGGDADTIMAVATGQFRGNPIGKMDRQGRFRLDDDFSAHLDHVTPPESVKGQKLIRGERAQEGHWNRFMDFAFDHLMTRNTNYLHRNPTYRQLYWNAGEDMLPFMDDATRASLLEAAAAEGGATKAQLARMRKVEKGNGTVTSLEDADFIAKKRALNGTKKLLYDMSEKSQFFDAMHLIIPFGEAWKEVLTRWAHLASENPKVLRRAQQVIVAARGNTEANDGRGNGFFHKDTNGDEVFTMPFSRNISKMVTGIPIDLTGRVAGLSLMADVLPGVGPVLQIPAAAILPNTPTWDFARDIIMPFGPEDYSGGILESALPQWAQRLKAAFGKGDETKFAATVSDVTNYLASTGEYNLNDPESASKLVEDANNIARKVEFFRAMGSAVSPTSPTTQFLAKTKGEYGDHMVLTKVLADDFWKLVENPKYGYDGAVEEFITRYGKDAFLSAQGKTFAIVPHQSMGKATGEWERSHQGVVKKFPLVWGLFAPGEQNEEDFDFSVRQRQLDRKERVNLTPTQRIAMAQRTLGAHIMAVAEAKVGDNPSKRGKQWLAYMRERVREEYPDYGRQVAGLPAKYETDTVVEQLERAVGDPRLADTKQAEAARLYLTARQRAIDFALTNGATRGGSSALGTQAADPARAWLTSYSRKVLAKYPEFQAFFDAVFLRELDD